MINLSGDISLSKCSLHTYVAYIVATSVVFKGQMATKHFPN